MTAINTSMIEQGRMVKGDGAALKVLGFRTEKCKRLRWLSKVQSAATVTREAGKLLVVKYGGRWEAVQNE